MISFLTTLSSLGKAQCPPTLANVHMLIGLNIVGHINPFNLLVTPTAKLGSTKLEASPDTSSITRLMSDLYLIKST